MTYDAIVIGAGMSGLAAGIRLAQFDRRVVVLERHDVWGGLNSFYTLGGRPFDVGLHAMTNYVPPRTPKAPLTRVLRQLRLRHEDLRLGEQHSSEIRFPHTRLAFANDVELLAAEVERDFPSQRDGFARLLQAVRAYELGADEEPEASGRAFLAGYLNDPLLVEMLLLPLCIYGSAREGDVDRYQLVVLFRSIFLEGLARPEGGVRTVLNLLVKRLRSLGGELRTRAGVARIVVADGRARGVVLEDGTELTAEHVLSSAGWPETMALCGREVPPAEVGRLSFLESISVLDRTPDELGLSFSTCFFSHDERPSYRVPEQPVDRSNGVISIPNNFAARKPLAEGCVRLTVLANHDYWSGLGEEDYRGAKEQHADAAIASAARLMPDWSGHTVFRDVFTPRTIRHFTGHTNGTVYGSPKKRLDGTTGIEGLALCGTDQGYLGIVGSLVSGAMMANLHALVPA